MSATGYQRGLTLWQKLDLVPAIFHALGTAFSAALFAPFRSQNTPATFKKHVIMSLMRGAMGRLSPAQQQFVIGSTEARYLAWTKQKNIAPKAVTLSDGVTKAFWVGDKDAETVVLFIHGGGWALSAGAGHFGFGASIVDLAQKSSKTLGLLFLDYDLAPGQQYPRQLSQSVELLRYALTTLGKRPSQIILSGDSAGASLQLGVLGHLLHPHPSIPPLELSEPLKSAALTSPWTKFAMDSEPFTTNALQDSVTVTTLRLWAANYMGAAPVDSYNQPGTGPAEWWEGLAENVQDLVITAAAKEMMAEDMRCTGERIASVHPRTTLVFAANDFHAEPVIGLEMGFEECEAAKVIKEWVVERL